MSSINLGRTDGDRALKLDMARLLDTRLLVQGNSGAGKSWLLRLIAEQTAGKAPTFILDPEGEYATLREKLDMVLVGSEGEIPADPRGAALLARKLMELRVSAVIDLYDLKLGQRREFVRDFLDSLLNLPKELYKNPVLIGIDEAHLFVPEKSAGESCATEAVIALMSQGRKKGLCGALLTQRLSKLHKDAAAECNNVIIGRTWLDLDQQRAADALGMSSKERQGLRDLAKGEFLAFGPAFDTTGVNRFRSASVTTTHPQAGQRHKIEAPAASAAIKAVLPELRDLPQKAAAKAKTEADLQAEIARLKRELSAAQRSVPAPAPPAKPVEVPVLSDAQVRQFREAAAALGDAVETLSIRVADIRNHRDEISKAVHAAQALSARQAGASLALPSRAPQPSMQSKGAGRPASVRPAPVVPVGDLSGPETQILRELSALSALGLEAPDKVQLALMCGYTNARSGGFSEPLGRLREAGLLTYPRPGLVAITEAGFGVVGHVAPPESSEDLQARLLGKLDGPRRNILKAAIAIYPEAVSKEDLARQLGYENPRSGGFSEPLGSLRSLGLIDYPRPGHVVACPVLFLEGR